ncbi:multifunctional CCA addition/repair protein [Leucothrix pacifica]|uniref:Multifunctional CCA protein n=1 Tax=Leucothrix pacifica TaxID=1247513 RepID=A0A317C888_9GAMM|nr:multifunctional CCA addition/repair protein [Leucothrix pacifica]PWQ92352.1 multifunctional CCA addition/repair protein [Leucothrix pacifica]
MNVYLVGGAVRDRLLGLSVKDRDWVVVGTSPKQMLAAGYHSVGKDFPVFLHPDSHEEYALARTERKTKAGYHGFEFDTAADVTLEQDLERRDLTINAIAEDTDGSLVDPFNGQQDLQNRVLRHVSHAFAEDPVRILRIARFLARFHRLGFTIADETMTLMSDMVKAGEVDALVPERVWQETAKALSEPNPEQFILALRECGALKILFPEIDRLFGVPQVKVYHPEVDTGIHVMMVLQQCCLMTDDPVTRFAALTHDLGKGITKADILPHHYGHEEDGVPLVTELCNRLKVPNEYRQLAELTCRYHTHIHRAFEVKPKTLLKVLTVSDAYRRPERFKQFLQACKADSRGRPTFEDRAYLQADFYEKLLEATKAIPVKPIVEKGFKGEQVKEELRRQRLRVIAQLRKENQGPEGVY